MPRVLTLIATLFLLTACTNANDLHKPPVPLGNFKLGHNVVVAPNLTKGPASREASKEEWIDAMKSAIEERFGRYDGDRLYHLGISIEGYVLAIPGVPVVASPKSALIIHVTAWDDAAGRKLNDKPEQITIMETISPNTLFGSGLTQSKEVQMRNLTRNSAKLIQKWLVQENTVGGWFEDGETPPEAPESLAIPGPQSDTAKQATTASGQSPAERAAEVAKIVMEPDVAPPTIDADSE